MLPSEKGKQPPPFSGALRHALRRASILYNKCRKKSMFLYLRELKKAETSCNLEKTVL